MKTLLKNLRIFNPFGSQEYFNHAAILIEGDQILAIYPDEIPGNMEVNIIDMAGKTCLPGMINAHTHLYSTLALGMPPPKNRPTNFVEILKEIWWKLDRGLDADSVKASFDAGLLDCLQNGTTTVIDHHASPNFVHGSLDMLVESAQQFGLNLGICFEASDRNGTENFQAELAENLRALKKYAGHPSILPMMGLHASFTLSDDSLKMVADSMAENPEWGIHIHVAEDLADQRDAQARGYESVVERLDHFGLLNNRAHIIHGVYINRTDRHLLLTSGCRLIHNPTSNAGNQVGILETEIIESLHAGLGTDGKQNNMLAEMKEGDLIRSAASKHLTDYMKLLFDHNPEIVSRAFGREIGHVDAGAQADLLFYDYVPRTEIHADNYKRHIQYGLSKPVDVMTRGKFRMRDGRIQGVDEMAIKKNAQIQASRLWSRML
jgi:putative selenium metabolism protein SsnA